MAPSPQPPALGGQALVEGVMMRSPGAWAAAVRRDDGTIGCTAVAIPAREGARRVPVVRGVLALVESVLIGVRALVWAANERATDPQERVTPTGVVVSVLLAVVLALGLFGAGPALATNWLGVRHSLAFSAVEGLMRLALLLGYLVLIGRSAEVRRTFRYHGAEHMTIHAFEHGRPLEADEIRRFPRQHPRCGTSFLVVTVLVTVVAFAFVGRASWPLLVASRVVGLPVVAGLAYELIRFAGLHQDTMYGRLLAAPGRLVQALTTRDPDDDQIEVAVAALHAVQDFAPADVAVAAPALAAPRTAP